MTANAVPAEDGARETGAREERDEYADLPTALDQAVVAPTRRPAAPTERREG